MGELPKRARGLDRGGLAIFKRRPCGAGEGFLATAAGNSKRLALKR